MRCRLKKEKQKHQELPWCCSFYITHDTYWWSWRWNYHTSGSFIPSCYYRWCWFIPGLCYYLFWWFTMCTMCADTVKTYWFIVTLCYFLAAWFTSPFCYYSSAWFNRCLCYYPTWLFHYLHMILPATTVHLHFLLLVHQVVHFRILILFAMPVHSYNSDTIMTYDSLSLRWYFRHLWFVLWRWVLSP